MNTATASASNLRPGTENKRPRACAPISEIGVRTLPSAELPQRDYLVGLQLDHFEVGELIGTGGMGSVYAGRDCSLDRRVAIKVLRPGLGRSEELRRRFICEARAQARVQSAHVAHIYHVGQLPSAARTHGALYFAMEHVAGGSLDEVLDGGHKLEPEYARQLMIEAAIGLRDASRAGVIHRDIKPGNLLLDAAGGIKIADFGVAKALSGAALGQTGDGVVVGTPHYMSPEQATGADVDLRTDMYALGCTFYHLLTGSAPFEAASPIMVAAMQVCQRAAPLSEVAPNVPRELADIIERMMEKEPVDRYASYEELIAELQTAAPQAVRPGGFWARAAAVALDAAVAAAAVALWGWLGLVIYFAYVITAHAYWGQTIGKYVLALQVQSADGSPLGLGASIVRSMLSMWLPVVAALVVAGTSGLTTLKVAVEHLQPAQLDALKSLVTGLVISNVVLSILYLGGLLLAALPRKRAMHDLVTGTRVVYKLDTHR